MSGVLNSWSMVGAIPRPLSPTSLPSTKRPELCETTVVSTRSRRSLSPEHVQWAQPRTQRGVGTLSAMPLAHASHLVLVSRHA